MVSRQGEALFLCQEGMDYCFRSRRFRDNWYLRLLRLTHSNVSCLGLKVSHFSYLEKTLTVTPVKAMHSISFAVCHFGS